MQEQWKPVRDWEDFYEVSDMGNVRSKHPNSRAPNGLAAFPLTNGYVAVNLSGGGRRKLCSLHRLVIEAFISEIPKGMHGSHLNGDKADNRLCNLAIETPSQNCSRRAEHGTQAKNRSNAKINLAIAEKMRGLAKDGWLQKDIASKFGVTQSNVSNVLSRKTWAG